MIISLHMTDKIHSNKFLRALWAGFRTNFGKCSWCYQPSRDGGKRYIHFGFMNIGKEIISVGITYKCKGVIKLIHFENIEEKSIIGQKIKKIINEIKNTLEEISQYVFYTVIASIGSLSEYKASNISIKPVSDIESLLELRVQGYDEIDARYQMLNNVEGIMAVLAIETNFPFWVSRSKVSYSKEFNKTNGVFIDDFDWMDGYPEKNECIAISQCGLAMLNEIASVYLESPRLETFVKSCRQFHFARKQDAQVWDGRSLKKINECCNLDLGIGEDDGQTEIATTLYMSSLEIAASIDQVDTKRCEKCGQFNYSIANRVMKLVETYSNEEFAKWIKTNYYGKRSKFLHIGEGLTDKYVGVSIPMLNDSVASIKYSIPLINVREHTSYFLRKVLYDKMQRS